MTIKEMSMIRKALCNYITECSECPLHDVESCDLLISLADWLTPDKEKELMDWYHKNANTYINDFCKRFPNVDMDYVVNNVCCGHIYLGNQCKYGNNFGGCDAHWNSVIDCE